MSVYGSSMSGPPPIILPARRVTTSKTITIGRRRRSTTRSVRLRQYLAGDEDDTPRDDGRRRDGHPTEEPFREEDREDARDGDLDEVVADEQRHEQAMRVVTEADEDRRSPVLCGDAFVEPPPREREDGDCGTGDEGTRRQ